MASKSYSAAISTFDIPFVAFRTPVRLLGLIIGFVLMLAIAAYNGTTPRLL